MNTNLFKKIAYSVIFLFALSCKKPEQVPYVPVDIVISENYLLSVGDGSSVKIIPSSNDRAVLVYDSVRNIALPDNRVYGNGIYLYKMGYGNYVAFDRTCTYKPNENYCATDYKKGYEFGNIVSCPCCESVFLLSNGGGRFSGPALTPLKPYRVDVLNGLVTISN